MLEHKQHRPDKHFGFSTQFFTLVIQVLILPVMSSFILSLSSLLTLVLLVLLCVIRKKSGNEGTYRPSAEEKKQTRAAGPEKPGLPLPKAERLI